jgi:amino acid adenylation domain-containing protein
MSASLSLSGDAVRAFPVSIADQLRSLATTRPDDVALTVLSEDGETAIQYAELDRRVRALAARLQSRFALADRVLLMLDNDDHYVVGFLACLYAGLIAVPVFAPEPKRERNLRRLQAIARDSKARCALICGALLQAVGSAIEMNADIALIAVDAVDSIMVPDFQPHQARAEDIAFLQYTSGSTARPKGVMVSHGNLMANERAIEAGMAVSADDRFVSWLPMFHDMGLIGGLLQPLHRGIPLVLASPRYFLERPLRWLQLISRYRGTISGAPDFAYRLCLERVRDAQVRDLDLSSWRVAFSGAEPVRLDTLQAFAERFAKAGFDANALYPCYGLAEATLFVTGGRRGGGVTANRYSHAMLAEGQARLHAPGNVEQDDGSTALVACGTAQANHQLDIVDVSSRKSLPTGSVGEIWVSGPSVSPGYWGLKRETAESFVERDGRRWLRTGDLGFLSGEQLFVTGRLKDLIILRGQNVYPQDIKHAIEESLEAARKGRVAAFAVQTDGREAIGVAMEISRGLRKLIAPARLVEEVSAIVSAMCQEAPAVLMLLNSGALPKTSSGKVQRLACRDGWRERTLDCYAIYEHGRFVYGGDDVRDIAHPMDEVESALAQIWKAALKCDVLTSGANFFALGGNSLSAVEVVGRIKERWGVDFAVRDLFEHPQISASARQLKHLLALETREPRSTIVPLSAADRMQPQLLSHAQQRLWFLWQLDPTNTAYHVSGRFRFSGQLDFPALRESFEAIVARHEALRTVFRPVSGGGARQYVLAALPPEVTFLDLRSAPPEDIRSLLADETRRIQETPFDLAVGSLLRVGVIQQANADFHLLLTLHHIVADGGSMQLLFDEFSLRYASMVKNQALVEASPPVQYVDYAAWERRWLDEGVRDQQLSWWREHLGEEHPVVEFPTDRARRIATSYRAARHEFLVPPALVTELRRRGEAHRATLFTVLLAAFQTLLQRYTQQDDVRVGVPVANRNSPQTHDTIGFFVNTLILRTVIDDAATLDAVLERTARALQDAQAHQDLPFEELVNALQPGRGLGQSPFFRVMMNHLRIDSSSLTQLPGLQLQEQWVGKQAAQFELSLDTIESMAGELRVRITWAAELFDTDTIERFAGHYLRLLESYALHPDRRVRDIELLGAHEQARLAQWGTNPAEYPDAIPVHVLFAQQAARSPEAIALAFGMEEVSFGELDRRATRLAHHLVSLGVRPDARVAIAALRSIEMVVGLLGILKAGGAYVPVDPEQPANRLRHLLEDSGARWLLTTSALEAKLPHSDNVARIVLDRLDLSRSPTHDPQVALHGDNLVYLIYTSGSSGRPKGTANRHRSLYNRLAWGQRFDPLVPTDVVLQKTPFNFDISFWEIFWPLTSGAKLVMAAPGDHRDPARLVDLIRRHGVTTIHFVPSMLQAFMVYEGIEACSTLRRMICSGEALAVDTQNRVFARLPGVRLYNLYGPTEAAIEVTHWQCVPEDRGTVPIGRPIANTRTLILDANLQVAVQGGIGELFLGGTALALGYPTRAGLTAERFIADPFSSCGERLYRTGDLARWRADGQIEYVGRADHQVKIRGHRIEPGEIEAHLSSQPEVREVAVLARDSQGDRRLVAYVVPAADALHGSEPQSESLRGGVVGQWESVFDSAYASDVTAPDFRGWTSSYSDEPIPLAEMQAWLTSTTERILALNPGRILEIGCGVGLLVRQLAARVPVYVATDVSAAAISKLTAWIATQPALAHVLTKQAQAVDLSDFGVGEFDTVVLNSVAQYFPDADYLLGVLEGAARIVGPMGQIFIGDLRHLSLLPIFHASVQLAKAPAKLTVRQLKARIDRAILQDRELVLDPEFFQAVSGHLHMGSVDVMLKRESTDNELTRYRYDVVLRGAAFERPEPEIFDWQSADAFVRLESTLAGRPACVRLHALPNQRLARDLSAWTLLQSADDQTTVEQLLAEIEGAETPGLDPETLWGLGEKHGYGVRMTWTRKRTDGAIDVEFIEPHRLRSQPSFAPATAELSPGWRSLAGDPLRGLRMQALGKRLRERLLQELPHYMVPSQLVVLQALPLTRNGKLDRNALPEPDRAAHEDFEAPQGAAEQMMASLWEEVLGIDRVGRQDNFFELGGHSLVANQISMLLTQRHGCVFPVRNFFERQTLSELAAQLDPAMFVAGRGRSQRLSEMASLLQALEIS